MTSDPRRQVVRGPRHEAVDPEKCCVRLEFVSRQPVTYCTAQVVDLSRQGVQVRLNQPVANGEALLVHIQDKDGHLNMSIEAKIRWLRVSETDGWSAGTQSLPMGVVRIGAARTSDNSNNSAPASALVTPPPAMISGRRAARSTSAA